MCSSDLEEAGELRDAVRGLPAGGPARTSRLRELRRVLRAAGVPDAEVEELGADAPIELWHSLLKVLMTFRLGPCYAPVHLVVGDKFTGAIPAVGGSGHAEYLQTWRSVAAGGLTVHRVPGTHQTMLTEPLVHHIAEIVESCMPGERAGKRAGAS